MKKNNSILLLLTIAIILSGCSSTTGIASVTPSPSATKRLTSTTKPIHKPNTAEATPVDITETNVPISVETTIISPTPYPKLAPLNLQDYIGLIVPPYPEELQTYSGGFLGFIPDGTPVDNIYGYTYIKVGSEYFLFFERVVERDEKGSFIWKILDGLLLPSPSKGQVIISQGCMLYGENDDEITVVGLMDEEAFIKRYLTNEKIRFAWRADRQKEVFIMLDTEGIECKADSATVWE
jgi:uncharacterized protein YceK